MLDVTKVFVLDADELGDVGLIEDTTDELPLETTNKELLDGLTDELFDETIDEVIDQVLETGLLLA